MPRSTPLDFAGIAQAALQRAEQLVPLWLPQGKREGREWSALNPLRADKRRGSFKVNLDTGQWSDFATQESGGDLVSLYAYLRHGGDQAAAARALADELRVAAAPAAGGVEPKAKRPRTPWVPVTPVPEAAGPPPKAHVVRGLPEASWSYRDAAGRLLGVVCRFRTSDGGKEILPCVWAQRSDTGAQAWRWLQWAVPRPLYGLDRMPGREALPVLVVEGEKCADAADVLLGDRYLVLSWPGGGKAVGRVDWSPLAGRTVIIWPDCDAQRDKAGALLPERRQPGVRTAEAIAALLAEQGCGVRIVRIPPPGEVPDGWDVADMIAQGATADAVLAVVREDRAPAPDADAASQRSTRTPGAPKGPDPDDDVGWLLTRSNGVVDGCLANVVKILSRHKAWRGVIAWDEFAGASVKLKPFPGRRRDQPGDWIALDTSHAVIWLTNHYMMTPTGQVVDEAVETVARARPFHRVREYLEALQWDGQLRTHAWLSEYLGVPLTEYSKRVARWYLVAMVARVMDPGVKFDYCLVLEGPQGKGKSTVFEVLAGEWFDDSELDIGNKDAVISLQGAWIHEFQEMGSLIRQEASRQKSFLTKRVDRVRPVYGRRVQAWPRQVVFGGTVNDWTWQKDPTGGRRFWPVEVSGDLDIAGLREVRDQLFAEAMHAWRKGTRFWPTANEQATLFNPEQVRRETEDSYYDLLHNWVDLYPGPTFSLSEAASDGLKIPIGQQSPSISTRIGIILRKLGCTRSEKRNGVTRFLYHVPPWSQYGKALAERRSMKDDDDSPLPI